MSKGFVHLHTHTEYSLLDGMGRMPDVVAAMAADHQKAGAVTDHGTGAGWWDFASRAKKAGIKPIIGIELYIVPDRFNPNAVIEGAKSDDARYQHLTVLCESHVGYTNLVQIVNESAETYQYKPLADYQLIAEHAEGLIVLTGCIGGPVAGPLLRSNPEHYRRAARAMLDPSQKGRRSAFVDMFLPDLRGAANRYAVAALNAFHDTVDDDDDGDDKALTFDLDAITFGESDNDDTDNITTLDELLTLQCDHYATSARRNLDALIDTVGKDNVYVEIMDHQMDDERDGFDALIALADEYDLPLVATNDSHYCHADDADTHEIWLAIQTLKSGQDMLNTPPEDRFTFTGTGYHLRTEQEMRDLHPDLPAWQEACDNTVVIADRCEEWVLPEIKYRMPTFPLPEGWDDSVSYLRHLVNAGAKKRFGKPTPELKDRLHFEMDTICGMGFADYFLIVHEVLDWARSDRGAITPEHPHGVPGGKKPILCGPGRGSAAGSLVAYCLGITDVEPLSNGLLFERFLEPGRPDMPDIDLDFEKNRAPEVVQHWREMYGTRQVCRIGTYQVSRSKKIINDTCRMLGASDVARSLTPSVPSVGGKPLPLAAMLDDKNQGTDTYELGSAFRDALDNAGEQAQQIISHAYRMENAIAGAGIHACGVIVSSVDLWNLIPLRKTKPPKGKEGDEKIWVTEWTGTQLADMGLLKMDVLAIRNLDVCHLAVDMIRERTGEIIDLSLAMEKEPGVTYLPDPNDHDDPTVHNAYAAIGSGHTEGMFQLESSGMTELATNMKPGEQNDLTALGALYRPGPLKAGSPDHYVRRKHKKEEVDLLQWTNDPDEQKIIGDCLSQTYGLIVYQEQIMMLSGRLAGFDATWRNKMRKAVAKKDPVLMETVRAKFITDGQIDTYDDDGNLTSPAIRKDTLEKLWEDIRGCGQYLFNASHAAAYGKVTFMTAWLKGNYPAYFAAALLSLTTGDKRMPMLRSLARDGIETLAPDVNTSGLTTTVTGDRTVTLGLSEVRDVKDSAQYIVAERERSGPYTSARDVARRVVSYDDKGKSRRLSSAAVVSLIECGACDSFGPRLGQVMSVFAPDTVPVIDAEWEAEERSARQRNRIGLTVGQNAMDAYAEFLAANDHGSRIVADDYSHDSLDALGHQWSVDEALDNAVQGEDISCVVYGVLSSFKEFPGRNGTYARFTVEGRDGETLRGMMWSSSLRETLAEFTPTVGQLVAANGRLRKREDTFVPAQRDVVDDDGDNEDGPGAVGMLDDDDNQVMVEATVITEIVGAQLHRIEVPERARIALSNEPCEGQGDKPFAPLNQTHEKALTSTMAKLGVRTPRKKPESAPAAAPVKTPAAEKPDDRSEGEQPTAGSDDDDDHPAPTDTVTEPDPAVTVPAPVPSSATPANEVRFTILCSNAMFMDTFPLGGVPRKRVSTYLSDSQRKNLNAFVERCCNEAKKSESSVNSKHPYAIPDEWKLPKLVRWHRVGKTVLALMIDGSVQPMSDEERDHRFAGDPDIEL